VALQLNRKLVVNILGIVVALGLVGFLLNRYGMPRIREWVEASKEITSRKKRLDQLKKAFSNQSDPKVELMTLRKEVKGLEKTSQMLEKVNKAGVETQDLPDDLKDPDPEIEIELYRGYIKEVMELAEENLRRELKSARIAPPDIELYSDLANAAEAAYCMNRAGGLRGIIEAMARTKTEGNTIAFSELTLEEFNAGKERRSGIGNVLSYKLNMKLNAQSLIAFMYNLREVDGYYFVEDMTLESAGGGRAGGRMLEVETRINTVLVYKSEAERQIKKGAADVGAVGGAKKMGAVGGFMALAAAMKKRAENELDRQSEKKWYEFWK